MSDWQPVEGDGEVEWLGLINKPSILNANAFLLRTPG